MSFDLASAKPDTGGFDLSSAKPEVDEKAKQATDFSFADALKRGLSAVSNNPVVMNAALLSASTDPALLLMNGKSGQEVAELRADPLKVSVREQARGLAEYNALPENPIQANVGRVFEDAGGGVRGFAAGAGEAVTSPVLAAKYLTEMLPGAAIGGGLGGALAKAATAKLAAPMLKNIAVGSGFNAGATYGGGITPNTADAFKETGDLESAKAQGFKQTAAETAVAALMGSPLNVGANNLRNIAAKALLLSPADEALQTKAGNSAIGKETTDTDLAVSAILGAISAPGDIAGAAMFREKNAPAQPQTTERHGEAAPEQSVDYDAVLDTLAKAKSLADVQRQQPTPGGKFDLATAQPIETDTALPMEQAIPAADAEAMSRDAAAYRASQQATPSTQAEAPNGAINVADVAGLDSRAVPGGGDHAAGGDAPGISGNDAVAAPGAGMAQDENSARVAPGAEQDRAVSREGNAAVAIKPHVEQLIKLRRVADELGISRQIDILIGKAKEALQTGKVDTATFAKAAKLLKDKDARIYGALQSIANVDAAQSAPVAKAAAATSRKSKRPYDIVDAILSDTSVNGINEKWMHTLTGESKKGNIKSTRLRSIFTPDGASPDYFASNLSEFDINTDDVDGGMRDVERLIQAVAHGEKVLTLEDQVAEEERGRKVEYEGEIKDAAKKEGINIVAKKFSAIEEEYFKLMEARQVEQESSLTDEEARALDDLMLIADNETIDRIMTETSAEYRDKSAREFHNALVARFTEALNEKTITGERTQTIPGDPGKGDQVGRAEAGAQAAQPTRDDTLQSYTAAEVAQREASQAAQERAQRAEEEDARAEQAKRDQAALDAKIKARTDNPENFQFGESSKQAAAPVGDLFSQQPAAENNQQTEAITKLTETVGKLAEKVDQLASKPNDAATGKIDDFGEKISGARKEYAAAYKDRMAEAKTMDVLAQPLSKSWPEPDYQKLIESGYAKNIVGLVRSMRDEIPNKPGKSYRQATWAKQVELLRDTADKLLNDQEFADKFVGDMKKVEHLKLDDVINGRAELYTLLGHEKSLNGIRISRSQYGVYNGVPYNPPKIIWEVTKDAKATAFGNMPRTLGSGDTRQAAIDSFAKAYSTLDTSKEKDSKTKFELYANRYAKAGDKGQYFIGKKVGRNVLHIKDGFDTVKEARAYMADHNDELTAILEQKKAIPNERYDTNQPRVGQDMRNAQDVTPQMFSEAFGFRGVQFGNYVEGARRQKDLNDAYDALMDLAAVLDVPPKALSLNGELGLAFGARGTGGKHPASAHYESGQVVINLTKGSGAGSLAHEFWHSLDSYFSRQTGKKDDFATDRTDVSLAARDAKYYFNDDGIRKEMIDAFGAVVKAINGTAIKQRSGSLDARRTKEYWGTGIEMSARAFERYVIAKLHDNGFANDYLANVVSEEYWNAAEALGIGEGGSYPYPTESELPAIRGGFDKFFQAIETKETDKGVALFSRGKPGGGQTVESVTKATARLRNGWHGFHNIKIVQSVKEVPNDIYLRALRALKPIDQETEGFYDPKTNAVYLIADNIATPERAAWVAAHEVVGHGGIRMLDKSVAEHVDRLSKNGTIEKLAQEIAKDRGETFDKNEHTQEAIAELAAAHVTEDAGAIFDRYDMKVPAAMQDGIIGVIARIIDTVRNFMAKVLSKPVSEVSDAEVIGLIRKMRDASEGQTQESAQMDNSGLAMASKAQSTPSSKEKVNLPRNTDVVAKLLPKSVPLLYSRDALGNIRSDLLGTRRLKDFLHAAFFRPMAVKMGMAQATPELAKLIRRQKADLDKAMRVASEVIDSTKGMSEEESALISRIVTQEMRNDDVPPDHAMKIAAVVEQAMTQQGQDAVDLKMLSQDAYEKWKGRYLPRFYMRHLDPELTHVWRRAFKSKPIDGFRSGSLKGRGKRQVVTVADLPQWEALGWKLDEKGASRTGQLDLTIDGKPLNNTDTVAIWKDYTPDERKDMGEIEDFRLRFVIGYLSMQRDLAVGRLYKTIAENPEWTRRTDSEGFMYVPETEIPDTGGLKRYGMLSGMYVKKEILDHISQYEQNNNEFQKYYKAALSKWKEGKTVLNPVTHMNNFVSNLTMAHFAGVSYWDGEKYYFGLKDLVKNAPMVQEAMDAGLFTGDFSQEEILKGMPPEVRNLMSSVTDSAALKGGRFAWKLASLGLNDVAAKAYHWGDTIFKYVIYRDARSKGMSPEDAVQYATKFIFNYDDLPSTARGIRDYVLPFFGYTYKVVPALLHVAVEYPWRFAAPATAIASINALGYAGLAGGDGDDDGWFTAILNGSMNALLNAYTLGMYGDGEAKTEGQKLEQEERKNLPEWDKGGSVMGTQKTIRMGMDENTGLPVFLNVYRFIPGGDIQDVNNEKGGIGGIPAPLMPSNPLLGLYSSLIDNRNWDGKELFDSNDTSADKAKKAADFTYKQLLPAIAPGGSHYDRILNGAANYFDTTLEKAHPLKDYTGTGRDGLPAQPKYAAMQTIGIKARPVDLQRSAEISSGVEMGRARGIKAEIKSAARLLDRGAISQREYDRIEREGMEKIDQLTAEQ